MKCLYFPFRVNDDVPVINASPHPGYASTHHPPNGTSSARRERVPTFIASRLTTSDHATTNLTPKETRLHRPCPTKPLADGLFEVVFCLFFWHGDFIMSPSCVCSYESSAYGRDRYDDGRDQYARRPEQKSVQAICTSAFLCYHLRRVRCLRKWAWDEIHATMFAVTRPPRTDATDMMTGGISAHEHPS